MLVCVVSLLLKLPQKYDSFLGYAPYAHMVPIVCITAEFVQVVSTVSPKYTHNVPIVCPVCPQRAYSVPTIYQQYALCAQSVPTVCPVWIVVICVITNVNGILNKNVPASWTQPASSKFKFHCGSLLAAMKDKLGSSIRQNILTVKYLTTPFINEHLQSPPTWWYILYVYTCVHMQKLSVVLFESGTVIIEGILPEKERPDLRMV